MNKTILAIGVVALTGLLLTLGRQENSKTTDLTGEGLLREFVLFRSQFGKTYSSMQEMEYRLNVFRTNLQTIQTHNADASQTYTLGVNEFSDMTFQEFAAYYLSPDSQDNHQSGQELGQSLYRPVHFGAQKVDWREHNIVSKVKNQGKCRSGWAFAAVSVVEEAHALFKKVDIPVLSEQELVDCSDSYENNGCNGGLSFRGLNYISDKGINLDKDYPYTATDDKCKSISGKGEHRIKSWKVLAGGPHSMLLALTKQPTTASFHVQEDFMSYKSGVYKPENCKGNRNHSVNVVGFNLETETPYFIVRNSWGTSWGKEGYFKIGIAEGIGYCWFNGDDRTSIPVLEA